MGSDRDDILGGSDWRIDPAKYAPLIDSATEIARTDLLGGLSLVLDVGLEIKQSLWKTAKLIEGITSPISLPALDLGELLSTLSRLKAPYEALTDLDISERYRGTIDSLASVAEIADHISQFQLPDLDKYRPERILAENIKLPSLDFPEYKFVREFDPLQELRKSVGALSTTLRSTWDMLGSTEAACDRISLPMLQRPAIELYTDIHAIGAITLIEEKQPSKDQGIEEWLSDSTSTFESRLGSLDKNLVEPYVGAIASIESGTPDWQRHSMISLREMTMHVLQRLAPDKEVKKIATGDDLHEGRPTRRARLKYIFADAAGPELAEFFEADLDATLKLFDLLNSGTHQLGSKATPAQLHYIRCRVVGLVGSMLEIQGY